MIKYSNKRMEKLGELLIDALNNSQTFEQHKNQNKMKQRKQYETYIGDDFIIEYTLLLTDWAGDYETPGANETEIIEATITAEDKTFNLPAGFIESFLESKLLNI